MDIKAEAGLISSILPLKSVFSDCSKGSPEFLPEINPKKNGLNISDKDGKYFGEGRYSLKFYNKKLQFGNLGLSVAF